MVYFRLQKSKPFFHTFMICFLVQGILQLLESKFEILKIVSIFHIGEIII